jgi:MFS family permease
MNPGRTRRGLLFCFALSGGAALIYEVVWTRALVLVVGGTRPATTTALAAFMLGLAVGSALAGPWVDRMRRPLRFYAALEVGIAAWGLAMPHRGQAWN